VQNPAGFGTSLAFSLSKNHIPPVSGSLLKKEYPMYLLFLPPVLAFVGIFAISLRNQFADYTDL
jgi:hypothetical protein